MFTPNDLSKLGVEKCGFLREKFLFFSENLPRRGDGLVVRKVAMEQLCAEGVLNSAIALKENTAGDW